MVLLLWEWADHVDLKGKVEDLYQCVMKSFKGEEGSVVQLVSFLFGGLQSGSYIEYKLDFATALKLNVVARYY